MPKNEGTQNTSSYGGGSYSSGSSSRGGGGSNYTYRSVPGTNSIGNWNTGGGIVGHGNITSGVNMIGLPSRPPGSPQPRQYPNMPPLWQPPVPPRVPPMPGVLPMAQRPEVLGAPRYDPLTSAYPPQASVPVGGFYPSLPDGFPNGAGVGQTRSLGQPNTSYPAYNPSQGVSARPDPSAAYGNDQYGSALAASQRLGGRSPGWGGMGSGGNRWSQR